MRGYYGAVRDRVKRGLVRVGWSPLSCGWTNAGGGTTPGPRRGPRGTGPLAHSIVDTWGHPRLDVYQQRMTFRPSKQTMQADLEHAKSGLILLFALALVRVVLHTLTNGQYGFHRDELATLDDARHLAWGYVAYPPLTPAVARVALELFGPSLPGLRLFAALAQGAVMVLAGLMARELGGGRWAQVVAALAVAIAPISLLQGRAVPVRRVRLPLVGSRRLLHHPPAALGEPPLVARDRRGHRDGDADEVHDGLLRGGARRRRAPDARTPLPGQPLALGRRSPGVADRAAQPALAGAARLRLPGVPGGHPRARRGDRPDAGLPGGAALRQRQSVHHPALGRGPGVLPLCPAGRRFRLLGWMYVVPFALFLVAQGRSYYLGPAYPMLLAAGAVVGERWLARSRPLAARWHAAYGRGAGRGGALGGA